MEWLILPIRRATGGRARRQEFWMFFLFFLLLVAVVIGVAVGLGISSFMLNRGVTVIGLLSYVVFMLVYGTMIVTVALLATTAVRRIHDVGYSGWLLMLWLIPLLGWLAVIILLALPGTNGPNKHGPDPKTFREVDVSVFA